MTTIPSPSGPHAALAVGTERERFLAELFDTLWTGYRARVSYVQAYENVIRAAGATLVNDHIAFRTLACQRPLTGMATLSRVFEALGYRAAGSYHFEDKHLSATHFQHPNGQFPKLFISELKTWELPPEARHVVLRNVASHRPAIEESALAALAQLDRGRENARAELFATVVNLFQELPWLVPERADVLAANKASQYAAWVLVHGYNVNHFTSLINAHGVPALDDIEKTIAALKQAGIPMKAEIEGARGTKLRQTATEAVMLDVHVLDAGHPTHMPWTYAYFELAQRDLVPDPLSGQPVRFEGFLGPQATNLFDMTKLS